MPTFFHSISVNIPTNVYYNFSTFVPNSKTGNHIKVTAYLSAIFEVYPPPHFLFGDSRLGHSEFATFQSDAKGL